MVVQACNRAGIGPSSQEIITTTLEDGRSLANSCHGTYCFFISFYLVTFIALLVITIAGIIEDQTLQVLDRVDSWMERHWLMSTYNFHYKRCRIIQANKYNSTNVIYAAVNDVRP